MLFQNWPVLRLCEGSEILAPFHLREIGFDVGEISEDLPGLESKWDLTLKQITA